MKKGTVMCRHFLLPAACPSERHGHFWLRTELEISSLLTSPQFLSLLSSSCMMEATTSPLASTSSFHLVYRQGYCCSRLSLAPHSGQLIPSKHWPPPLLPLPCHVRFKSLVFSSQLCHSSALFQPGTACPGLSLTCTEGSVSNRQLLCSKPLPPV